ncbi:phosphatidylglycerophosphatase A family protein [Geoalkalibacter subterraneus]|jgi:phosphatidylglycerophosphatase A|uniref:Phosphatidylglycerophosphatase n=1 Tax=Geoalkalibacter subterraneus TaxID=483547 RepID=A0A0B5FC59_9BACT|nr:phosphatidylglycerophosphatase A [Geoalkalibacter subterraneus]AJF05767.1 phosphatidylglycerophosphatase [Geoalkalibacter subterraneus]
MKRFILLLATNGGLGYFPRAPGTIGTLAGIPVYALLSRLSTPLYLLTWLALLALACWTATHAGRIFGVIDDRRIVIDELVGYLVAVVFVPFSWTAAIAGFFLFRFFDIAKIWPASWFDRRMKNGVGVVLDDVAAGIYAAFVLHLLLYFRNLS